MKLEEIAPYQRIRWGGYCVMKKPSGMFAVFSAGGELLATGLDASGLREHFGIKDGEGEEHDDGD